MSELRNTVVHKLRSELKRFNIKFTEKPNEFVIKKKYSVYLEEESDSLVMGALLDGYAIFLKYSISKKVVSKFRAIVPKIDSFSGTAIDALFVKVISIFAIISEQILKSRLNPNFAVGEVKND